MKKIYDSTETLKAGLKAEQATVVEYTEYLNLAKANNNEREAKLWEHIIADEKEHIKEFENALKGNFELHDDKFSYSDLRNELFDIFDKNNLDLEAAGNFNEGGSNVFLVFGKNDKDDRLEDIKKCLSDIGKYGLTYQIEEVEGWGDSFLGDIRAWKIYFKKDVKDDVIIREKTPEQIAKHEEIVEDFTTRLFDVLADANIDPNKYGIREEDPYYYIDFADEEGECLRGYEALNDSLFKCDFVDDEGFYYIRVLRR